MKRLGSLLPVLVLLAFPTAILGYNNTVHYFLTVVVTENVDPPMTENEIRFVSFCAQLPDETEKLDAAKQYQNLLYSFGDYWSWANTANDGEAMVDVLNASKVTREMVTVQQLLHGLTGGKGSEMLVTADNVVKSLLAEASKELGPKKSEKLCAVGFAIHLLADALAHRDLESGGLEAEGRMYPTGKGHALHGNRPDDILLSVTGIEGIERYDSKIPSSFPENRSLKPVVSHSLHSKLRAANKKWFGSSATARRIIIDSAGAWAKQKRIRPDEHENESCQAYLNHVVPTLTSDFCVPSCNAVFRIFAKAAIPEFAKSHESRRPQLSGDQYVFPVIDGEAIPCARPE